MKNFVFHNPTKIIFGQNTLATIGAETQNYGNNVLLVYGQGSIFRNGAYDTVMQSFKDAGCSVTEFGGVQPNPTLEGVKQGLEMFRKNNCNILCAVGGGSVIDTTKAISCAIPVEHDVWKFFTAKKSIKTAVPFTCVATIAGSGSENNSGMVITHDEKRLKFGYGSRFLYPQVSVLDPAITFSVSKRQTAYGSIDIISHLVEFYCSNSLDDYPVQGNIMEGIIKAVIENTETALDKPTDYLSRAQLLWASSIALGGLPSSGLGRIGFPMHLIEHSISALYNSTHGAGLSIILPGWMKHQAKRNPEKIARLGRGIFPLDSDSLENQALETAARFKNWFATLNCPVSLAELHISAEDFSVIAEHTGNLAKIWRLREYDSERVLSILRLCS